MRLRPLVFLALSLPLSATFAETERMPVAGDCALFREGGAGYILTAPTYFVRGTVSEVYTRSHRMDLCPNRGKPPANYTRDDWQRFAEAYPCVNDAAQARDVEVVRIRLRVDDWDTPWALQHGRNGMLMKGHFLDVELKEGIELDVAGTLLERCEARP